MGQLANAIRSNRFSLSLSLVSIFAGCKRQGGTGLLHRAEFRTSRAPSTRQIFAKSIKNRDRGPSSSRASIEFPASWPSVEESKRAVENGSIVSRRWKFPREILLEKGGPKSLSEKRYPLGENRNGGIKSIQDLADFCSLSPSLFLSLFPFPSDLFDRCLLFNDRVIARDENVTERGNSVKTERTARVYRRIIIKRLW